MKKPESNSQIYSQAKEMKVDNNSLLEARQFIETVMQHQGHEATGSGEVEDFVGYQNNQRALASNIDGLIRLGHIEQAAQVFRQAAVDNDYWQSIDINENLLMTIRKNVGHLPQDVVTDVLVSAEKNMQGPQSLYTRRNWRGLVLTLIDLGRTKAVQEAVDRQLQRLEAYKTRLDSAEEKYETSYSIFILTCSDIVKIIGVGNLSTEVVDTLITDATEVVEKLHDGYADRQPYPAGKMVEGFILGGQVEGAEELAQKLFVDAKPYSLIHKNVRMAAAFAEVDDIHRAQRYLDTYYQLTHSQDHMSVEVYEKELEALSILGEKPNTIQTYQNLLDRTVSDLPHMSQGQEQLIRYVFRMTKQYWGVENIINYLDQNWSDSNDSFQYENTVVFHVLGEDAPFNMVIKALQSVRPTQRFNQLVKTSVLSTEETHLKDLQPYITGLPESLDYDTLLLYLPQVLHPNRWEILKKHVLEMNTNRSGHDVDAVRFLLLEFSHSNKIARLVSFLKKFPEKLAPENIEYYRAILQSSDSSHVLYSHNDFFNDLADRGVITEGKHIAYLDRTTADRIRSMASIQSGERLEVFYNFIAHVLKTKTSYLAQIVHCASELQLDLSEGGVQEEFFEALDDLGGITPVIFRQYRALKTDERTNFVEGIKRLRSELHINQQLTPELIEFAGEDFDEILAEIITILYKPRSFTSETVQNFIRTIRERTQARDLVNETISALSFGGEHWDSEQQCYALDMAVIKTTYVWKEDRQPDEKSIQVAEFIGSRLKETTERIAEWDQGEIQHETTENRLKRDSLSALVKRGGAVQPHSAELTFKHAGENHQIPMLSGLFMFFSKETLQRCADLEAALSSQNATDLYSAIAALGDVFGTKDNQEYSGGVLVHDEWRDNVLQWLQSVNRRILVGILNRADTDSLEELANTLVEGFEENVLKKIARILRRETAKLASTEIETESGSKPVRMYVSKNVASFFAKASAGLCTQADISLFLRNDHFHLNVVDDETNEIIGNIQMYILPIRGKQYLLLRGINPTVKFSSSRTDRGFIEAVLTVASEIAESSGFSGLLLSESLGAWHADSNRPGINSILRTEYLKASSKQSLPRSFPIANDDQTTIKNVHVIWKKDLTTLETTRMRITQAAQKIFSIIKKSFTGKDG